MSVYTDFTMYHTNQIKVAQNILTQFETKDYVQLQAHMQSGKTGASLFAGFSLLSTGKFTNVKIISGMSDNDLKSQWINKFDAHFDDYFIQSGLTPEQIKYNTKLKKLNKNNVLFGVDIYKINTIEELKDTYLIIDEIHYGANEESVLDNLFIRLNIKDILIGKKCDLLKEYNIKILTVTATNANQDALYHNTDICEANLNWGRAYMEPGDNYKSIVDYYYANLIHKNFKLCEKNENLVNSLFTMYKETSTYMIVRAVSEQFYYIEDYLTTNSINYILYDQKNNILFDKIKPTCFTVVLIKNKLRLGKELNKEYISAVFESSMDMNTDTLLQGLAGRVCGYNVNNEINIYLPFKNQEVLDNIIQEYIEVNKEVTLVSLTKTKFVKKRNSYDLIENIDACDTNIIQNPNIKKGCMHSLEERNLQKINLTNEQCISFKTDYINFITLLQEHITTFETSLDNTIIYRYMNISDKGLNIKLNTFKGIILNFNLTTLRHIINKHCICKNCKIVLEVKKQTNKKLSEDNLYIYKNISITLIKK